MRRFDSYQEFLTTVLVFSQNLSNNSLLRIDNTRDVISNNRNMPAKEKYNFWRKQIHLCLWEVPEAVNIGFNAYLDEKLTHYRDALRYHDENCHDYNNCNICKTKADMLEKMRNLNDKRTEPQIYSQ